MKKIAIPIVVIVAAFSLSSCDLGKMTEPFKDAPRSGTVNDEPADLITMPDGFTNVATKCDHGNRVYSGYHGDSAYATITVVPNAKDCQ